MSSNDSSSTDPSSKLRADAWRLLYDFYDRQKAVTFVRCQEFGLTIQQGGLLRQLKPGRPVAMNELAMILGCDASNVTGLVDRLEERRLVKRQQQPHDRRVKMIVLTKAGVVFHRKLMASLYEPGPSMDYLSPMELQQLCSIFEHLREELAQEPKTAA